MHKHNDVHIVSYKIATLHEPCAEVTSLCAAGLVIAYETGIVVLDFGAETISREDSRRGMTLSLRAT